MDLLLLLLLSSRYRFSENSFVQDESQINKFCLFIEQRCTGIVDSIADGICDDENTNIECYFDGGDCCFNPITMCDDCYCLYGKKEVYNNFSC